MKLSNFSQTSYLRFAVIKALLLELTLVKTLKRFELSRLNLYVEYVCVCRRAIAIKINITG